MIRKYILFTLILTSTFISSPVKAKVLVVLEGGVLSRTQEVFLEHIYQNFELKGIELVKQDILNEIGYVVKEGSSEMNLKLEDAINQYYNLNIDVAKKTLSRIIDDSCSMPLGIRNGKICFKALIYDALINKNLLNFKSSIKKIRRAIEIAPNVILSDYVYPESFAELYENIRNEYSFVELEIFSLSGGVDVYINGFFAGKTPLKQNVSKGEIFITFKDGDDEYVDRVEVNENNSKYYFKRNGKNYTGDYKKNDLNLMKMLGVNTVLFLNAKENRVYLKKIQNNRYVNLESFKLTTVNDVDFRIEKTLSEESVQYLVSK